MNLRQPIFIVAAPRSGSTLLFETLMQHRQLWSFGDEGHGWIESHPSLRPLPGGVASNRLTEANLTAELADQLRVEMVDLLESFGGNPAHHPDDVVRVIEKTPKNCLRIPFINAIYPDARFIYLYRRPAPNIASIMEGWRHQRFVTYREMQTPHGYWCFLRPPGWHKMVNAPLADIAAYQWALCHDVMLNDLATIDETRWMTCAFEEFLAGPSATVSRIEAFCDLEHDTELAARCEQPLPLSRYTQTVPADNKWRSHEAEIQAVWPRIMPVMDKINRLVARAGYELPMTMES